MKGGPKLSLRPLLHRALQFKDVHSPTCCFFAVPVNFTNTFSLIILDKCQYYSNFLTS